MSKENSIKIYSLAYGGAGVGKVDGKVCFVRGALPGEEVTFEVAKEASSYTEADVKEILTPSPDRIEPVCRYYGMCGGCQTQHVSYEKELEYKTSQVEEILARIAGKGETRLEAIEPSRDCYNYRTSVTLHKSKKGVGYFGRGSKNLIEIDQCPLAVDPINKAIGELAAPGKIESRKPEVTLKSDHTGRVWSSDVTGERFYLDRYLDVDLFMSPKAFSQANRHISEAIALTIEEWIGDPGEDAVLFDVYCGVGFFSFLLKQDFKLRIGIDQSRVAIDCAKNTLVKRGPGGIKFYCGEAEKDIFPLIDRNGGGNNIILLDPPRSGVPKRFLEELTGRDDIAKLYYLSCDPARFARDLKILEDGGKWTLARVKPFDMFPRTKHIEVLGEFVRR